MEDNFGDINKNFMNVTFTGVKEEIAVPVVVNITLQSKERPTSSSLFAKVKSLDQFGELVIEFNHPMKTDFNLTYLNS